MPPQLTVNGPGQRRRGGHSGSSSGSNISRASKEARFLLQLQISNSRREQDADSTYRPNIKPTDDVGSQFEPFDVPDYDFAVRQPLPPTPIQLFQQFLPEHIIERWVHYTNEGTANKGQRGQRWKKTSVAELYLWVGILIYMSLHREKSYRDYWKTSRQDRWIPDHPIRDFMPHRRFASLKTRVRLYDTDTIEIGVPAPFSKVNEWARHIMETAVSLVVIGCMIAIDEIIAGFKGRSRHKVTIKTKPTPTGLKIWALAAGGYLLRWLWHQPGPKYGPVGLLATTKARPSQQSQRRDDPIPDDPVSDDPVSDDPVSDDPDDIVYSSSSDDSADEGNGTEGLDIGAPVDPFDETTSQQPRTDILTMLPPLNPTQAVVVTLVSQLPEGIYHVIDDNLFSSPDLFRALRALGVGATGTCRTNCGLFRDIIVAKENDRKGKQLWPWGRLRSWPTSDGKVNQIAWKDNSLVLFLSTVFTGLETIIKKRKRPNSTQPYSRSIKQKFGLYSVLQLSLPSIAAQYNDYMNGVDRADQLRANQASGHRERRGPARALSWSFLLQTAIANSFILQRKGNPRWEPYRTLGQWQQALINDIFRVYGPEGSSRQLYRPGNSFIPMDQHIRTSKRTPARCLACQDIQIGSRSQSQRHTENRVPLQQLGDDDLNRRARLQSGQPTKGTFTRWGCQTCNVALCKGSQCWDFYRSPIS